MSRGKYGCLVAAAICLAIIPSYLCETETVTVKFQQTDPPVELICKGESLESNKLTWKLNGTDIKTRKDWTKEFTIYENNTLRLLKVEPNTVGVGPYSCCNESTGIEILSFNMKVLPHINKFDKPRNVIEGDPLSLECKAWGIPEPVVTWYRNGTEIVAQGSGGKITLKKNTESGGSATIKFPPLENTTLRIEKMEYEEGGNYTCVATSEIGVANATVLVQIKDKYAALWPFLGICVEVAVLCTIILIYEKRRAKRIEEEEREEEAAHLNANNDTKAPLPGDDVRQRK